LRHRRGNQASGEDKQRKKNTRTILQNTQSDDDEDIEDSEVVDNDEDEVASLEDIDSVTEP